ncbi:MAG: ribosome-associated translation inhibitor RaiA [Herpetosiphon sp.]
MQVTIKCRNGKLTETERAYLEEKLTKLERYKDGIGPVVVEVTRRQERGAGSMHVVQATLQGEHGVVIRAERREHEWMSTVDALHDQLQRQLTRYKDGHHRRREGRGDQDLDRSREMADGQSDPSDKQQVPIIRRKQFHLKPMSTEEAIEQMELLQHTFFVFTDDESHQTNVVYRRQDGGYGVIEAVKGFNG